MLSLLDGPVMRVVRAMRCCSAEENAMPYMGSTSQHYRQKSHSAYMSSSLCEIRGTQAIAELGQGTHGVIHSRARRAPTSCLFCAATASRVIFRLSLRGRRRHLYSVVNSRVPRAPCWGIPEGEGIGSDLYSLNM